MNAPTRDLLVLTKRITMKPGELKYEIERIVQLLRQVENFDVYAVANEIIDLNRYKIIQKHNLVLKALKATKCKPFVFISNRN